LDSEIEIRPARIEDAEAIRSMIEGLAHETLGPQQKVLSADAVRRYGFGAEKSFDCFVADHDGRVVAVIILFDEFSTWRGEKGVYVLDIFIAPSARGLGLGKRLIAQAAEWGETRGAKYVRLCVDQDNTNAIEFYKAVGFKEGAHDRAFLLSGESLAEIGGAR